MENIRFGRTGLYVSRICLGTGTFGLHSDETTGFAIMDKAAESGINFFDMANKYPIGGNLSTVGTTETIVGKWLKGRRDDFIVATKVHGRTGPNPWDHGNSRKNIMQAIDASLKRLQTDYVDLYQLHGYDKHTEIDETLRALDDVVKAGKVRYVGCSNFLAYQLARALGRSEFLNLVRFASIQPRYNLLFRENERELLPLCREEGIAVDPYNPAAGGMLSGTYQRGEPPPGSRFTLGDSAWRYTGRYWNDDVFDTIDNLRKISADAGMTMIQMSLSWLIANPAVACPIVGADHPDQLNDAVRAVQTPMSTDLKQELDDLTARFRTGDELL